MTWMANWQYSASREVQRFLVPLSAVQLKPVTGEPLPLHNLADVLGEIGQPARRTGFVVEL